MRWRTVPDDGPRPQVEGDAISRQLDTITLEEHLMARHRISRETVRTSLSPVEGGGYGRGIAAVDFPTTNGPARLLDLSYILNASGELQRMAIGRVKRADHSSADCSNAC